MLLFSSACMAQDDEGKWSVTPLLGVSSPSLSDVNDGVFKAPILWSGNIIVQPSGVSQPENITIINPLPKIRYGTQAGVEIAYDVNSSNAVVLGYSTWEGSSSSTTRTVLPFQGIFSQVFYQRSGSFSYNSFSLGWRHKLFADEGKWRLNTQVALRELFDIDYRETMVFLFQTGPAQSFKRIIQIIPQATGVTMLRLGLDGEYFPTSWISIGLRGGYNYGFQAFSLGNTQFESDIQTNDNVGALQLSMRQGANGRIQYLSPDGSRYSDMKIRMDGWDLLLSVTFYL